MKMEKAATQQTTMKHGDIASLRDFSFKSPALHQIPVFLWNDSPNIPLSFCSQKAI
jgi:hypothetical protein